MKIATVLTTRRFLSALTLLCFLAVTVLPGCERSLDNSSGASGARKRKPPPPPPPQPFYFNNCTHPTFSGTFRAGEPANVTTTLNYINSPGGSYPAFTSSTVNGLTVTAPAGTLNVGTGSIVFRITGTPVAGGIFYIPVSVGGAIACQLGINVANAPPDPATCGGDPAAAIGSVGCVTFTYRGQTVTYSTVRAADGKIWLRQNLGSPQVAMGEHDQASAGHYFQWGRWDDGHQVPGSAVITGSSALQNPSHIASGNSKFIIGSTNSTSWWGSGGSASDTWSGTVATSTNGKDPCAALGDGWRLPTASEWWYVVNAEGFMTPRDAFLSNLKLTSLGYRTSTDGTLYQNIWVGAYYWSSTASGTNNGQALFFDDAYNMFLTPIPRGYGFPCRCIKD